MEITMYLNKSELTCWDNEDNGEAAAKAAAEAAAKAAATAAAINAAAGGEGEEDDKVFKTQAEVNKYVAERNKTLKAEFEKLQEGYNQVIETKGLADKQREKLEADRDNLRKAMMTEKERLEDEKRQAAEQFQTDIGAAQEEALRYKNLFETSTIHRGIVDAQAKHKGFNAQQFISYLGPMSEVQPELDSEGLPTGNLVPRVKWDTVGEDGLAKTVWKTPEEAVVAMKEDPVNFGNMFQTNVAAGIGAGTAPGQKSASGKIDHTRISTDEYMKLAKTAEGRVRLGIE